MPGPTESWIGVASIRKNFAGVLAQYSANIHLHSVRSEASGNLAYDSGLYDERVTPVKGGKVNHVRGNYLFIFKRQKNGEWKFLEQTWTEFGPEKL
jgi:ketosteroid isomerase-like protein